MASSNASFMQKAGLYPLIPLKSADGEWEIMGECMNVLHIKLKPGQAVQGEPGSMIYANKDLTIEAKMAGLGRMLTQGAFAKVLYKNVGSHEGFIGMASNYPADIVPFNLDSMGGSILCKDECFVGAMDPDATINIKFLNTNSCLACCCSGLSPVMQEVRGKGWVFLCGHGSIIQKTLAPNEQLAVDTNSIIALSSSVKVDVVMAGTCKAVCCGGEGCFNTTLLGPGLVVLTSFSIQKLRNVFRIQGGGAQQADDSANSE